MTDKIPERLEAARRNGALWTGSPEKTDDVDFMATHAFPLEETQQAFDLAAGYRDSVIKAMIFIR